MHQLWSGAAWELARAQHGVVARRQLLALGLSGQAIQHRLSKGRLYRIDRGVYAVGRPQLDRDGRWMAAVLACGSRAVLSHSSAAAHWGIARELRGTIEVTVPFPSPRRRPGIRVHRRPGLRDTDVVIRDEISITNIVRTLIDLAARLGPSALERAVNEADRLELIDPAALLAALSAYPGQRGVGPLRALLGDRSFRLTDSELERRFLGIVSRTALRTPVTGMRLNGFKVDFYWPDLGLVVETDGLRYHRTPAQQARDLIRDQAHIAAGLTSLRFSHAQVRFEPDQVRARLIETASRLNRSSGVNSQLPALPEP